MKYLFFSLALLFSSGLFAQPEHRVSVDGRAIEFKEIDKLMIVGYDGNEVKISRGEDNQRKTDARAKGMRKISASGKKDNTGFGLSAQGLDERIVIEQVGKSEGLVVVSVPNKSIVRVEQSTWRGGDFTAKNFNGELDVSMAYHKAILTNCYGPLSINTIYGSIETTFSSGPPTEDLRLHSTYQNVDITLPRNTAANLRLSTSYGSMYTDFDLDVKPFKSEDHNHDEHKYGESSGGLTGTINGGGNLISLTASYKNIYLRQLE